MGQKKKMNLVLNCSEFHRRTDVTVHFQFEQVGCTSQVSLANCSDRRQCMRGRYVGRVNKEVWVVGVRQKTFSIVRGGKMKDKNMNVCGSVWVVHRRNGKGRRGPERTWRAPRSCQSSRSETNRTKPFFLHDPMAMAQNDALKWLSKVLSDKTKRCRHYFLFLMVE